MNEQIVEQLDGELAQQIQTDDTPPSRRYWKISPGERAWAWDEFRQRNVIAVGWGEANDLRQSTPLTQKELENQLRPLEEMAKYQVHSAAEQLWNIYHDMRPGDMVCAYGQGQVLGYGEIVGEYVYQKDEFRYPHRRTVKWLSVEPVSAEVLSIDLRSKIQQRRTIIPLTEAEFTQILTGDRTYALLEIADCSALFVRYQPD